MPENTKDIRFPDYQDAKVKTYTDTVIRHRVECIVQDIKQDIIRMSQEIPSITETEEMEEIPQVLYAEAEKIIHYDIQEDEPAEDITEDKPAPAEADQSAGPSASQHKPKISIFSEPSIDEFTTPPETPAKVLVE